MHIGKQYKAITQNLHRRRLFAILGPSLTLLSLLIPEAAHAVANPAEWFLGGTISWLFEEAGRLVLTLVSWILWASGILLNQTIQATVIHMADTIRGITAIDVGWKVFRDLANMLFIFALLYIAMATIFNASTHSMRQSLIWLILAALLINFSLFFTKVVIDASNIVAAEFYNSISVQGQRLGDMNNSVLGNADAGLSDAFMQPLKLQSLYDPATGGMSEFLSDAARSTIGMVMGSVFIFITACIFLIAAALFIVRFVVLVFLMMLSPFAVAGWILPQLKGLTTRWSTTLYNQAVFAPLFMMLCWIVLKIISTPDFLGNGGDSNFAALVSSGQPGTAVFGTLLNYGVIIAFIIATLALSKGFAVSGVPLAQDAVNRMTSFAGGAVFGTAGRIGRQTIGRGANRFLNNEDRLEELRTKAEKGGFAGRNLARLQLWSANKASTASFDARNVGLVKKGVAISGTGLQLGSGKTGGYKADLEARQKPIVDSAKQIYGDTREITTAALQQRVKQAEEELQRAQNIYNNAPAASLQKAGARRNLAAAMIRHKQLAPLANDLKTKTPAQMLQEAKDDEKKANEAYAKATNSQERERAGRNLQTARERQQDLYGERLQNLYAERLEKGNGFSNTIAFMRNKRAAQKSAAKAIKKEGGGEKMKSVDEAIARTRDARDDIRDQIRGIKQRADVEKQAIQNQIEALRKNARKQGRRKDDDLDNTEKADLDRLTDEKNEVDRNTQVAIDPLSMKDDDLRNILNELEDAKKFKIKDPYTFLTNLRREYPNAP